jgi:hypothetical protein
MLDAQSFVPTGVACLPAPTGVACLPVPTGVACLPVPKPLSASSGGITGAAVIPASHVMPGADSMEVTPQYQLEKHGQYGQYGMQQDNHAHVQQDNHAHLLQDMHYHVLQDMHYHVPQALRCTTEYLHLHELHDPQLQAPLGIYILKDTHILTQCKASK